MSYDNAIDPRALFERLRAELPPDVISRVVVVGSLAAACHHADQLVEGGVKTKDADLVIHPARDVAPASMIAQRLRERGWRPRTSELPPGTRGAPASELPAIRLYPPDHDEYFVEILIVPEGEAPGPKPWMSVELEDGWYGVPSFEFLALTMIDRQRSASGIEYAHPCMMALANLLSHPELGTHVMSSPIGGRKIHRSSKDLGRVLALARLATRDETQAWIDRWRFALASCFPTRRVTLARRVGQGLRALLDDDRRFDEAWHCGNVGLLAGLGVTKVQLRAIAMQLLADVIEPIESD